ncbi:MAG: TerB family tellurite resistance protein [Deltaproteobacteria bacterium]|nr:MAG: TerB family tellurite resistance protein [Deltaproteobacteria bacterium]
MPEPLLKVPTSWTPLHSVAYLLLGVSIADGSIDEAEMNAVRRMVARHGQCSPEEADAAVSLAFAWLQHVLGEQGRDGFLRSLHSHATRLANHYGPPKLRAVVTDMLAVAQADGSLDDAEVVLIQAVANDWQVSDEG